MSVTVTVTLKLPGRSAKAALKAAGDRLYDAAWEDYPDRIQQNRSDGDLAYANVLTARCDLLESLGLQFKEAAK